MTYQINLDLPAKLKELRDNIDSRRYAESIVAAEMFAARANKNIDEIEAGMSDDLLLSSECPFCGSIEIMQYDEPSQADDKMLWQIHCLGCRASGPIKYTLEDAKGAWKKRAWIKKLSSNLS